MGENNTEPKFESLIGRAGPPPLRIHHFLIWIAVTALLLTLMRIQVDSWQRSKPDIQLQTRTISSAVSHILLSGLITISLCVIRWRMQRIIRHIEPGEWIAMIVAADSLANIMYGLTIAAIVRSYGIRTVADWHSWLAVPGMCLDFIWLAVLGVLVRSSYESLLWRCVYFLLALQRVVGLVILFLLFMTDTSQYIDTLITTHAWANTAITWLITATAIAAIFGDRIQRRERRWTHWFGMLLYIVQTVYGELL